MLHKAVIQTDKYKFSNHHFVTCFYSFGLSNDYRKAVGILERPVCSLLLVMPFSPLLFKKRTIRPIDEAGAGCSYHRLFDYQTINEMMKKRLPLIRIFEILIINVNLNY